MPNSLTNVRFGEQPDIVQPPFTNLDLWVHGLVAAWSTGISKRIASSSPAMSRPGWEHYPKAAFAFRLQISWPLTGAISFHAVSAAGSF